MSPYSSTKKKNKATSTLIKQSVHTPTAIENIKTELSNYDFSRDLSSDLKTDPNINYNILINKVIEIKNKHIPTKMVKFNKHKHKKQKWITTGLIKSIKFRDKLHLQLKRTKSNSPEYPGLKQNLKTYNDLIKKNI